MKAETEIVTESVGLSTFGESAHNRLGSERQGIDSW